MGLWERYEGIASKEEVANAQLEFKSLAEGDYDLILKSIEATENKDGLPMLKVWFSRVDNGESTYYNQVLQNINYPNITSKNIKKVLRLLNGFANEDREFEGMAQLDAYVTEIASKFVNDEFRINVSYDNKDKVDMKYPNYKVVVPTEPISDEDVPF